MISVEYKHQINLNDDPLIFVFNHNCSFEVFMMPAWLFFQRQGRPVSFLIDWMYGVLPGIGWLFNQIDPVFVFSKPARFGFIEKKRSRLKKRNVYQTCQAKLKQNVSIGIFPEGVRNRNPLALLKARPGIGKIILTSDAPVIAIGIDFPLRRHKNKIPKLGRIDLRIGKKQLFADERRIYSLIRTDEHLILSQKHRIEQELVACITHQVMQELSRLSGKIYPYTAPETAEIQSYLKKEEALCPESA